MKRQLTVILAVAFGLATLLSANPADAFYHEGRFSLRVLGHKFTKVSVSSYGCKLRFTVHFNAPYYKYTRGQYYRFQAKVTLKNGAWIRTSIFGNRSAGSRTFTYTHNTASKGCWASRRNRDRRVGYLNVRACVGQGCRPPSFGSSNTPPPRRYGWEQTGNFSLRVLGHKFTKVRVRNVGCKLKFTVFFDAPYYKYTRGQYYRFQAKVTMGSGAWIRTGIFGNSSAGNRTYTYTHNTANRRCWATKRDRVSYLNVRVCRGRGCSPPPFR